MNSENKKTGGGLANLANLANSTLEQAKLAPSPHDDAIREHLEERAAIQEYDGGLPREKAETEARKALRVFEYKLTDNPDAWLVLIAPGCDLEDARESLRKQFEGRLLDVRSFQIRGGDYEKERQSR